MSNVQQLYKSFSDIKDAKVPSEQVEAFNVILQGAKGDTATKRLSAQFIARFFKHFSELAEESINVILDLCEDADSNIRKAAIKEIPKLCTADKKLVERFAPILIQLLTTGNNVELSVVNASLKNIFSLDYKTALKSLIMMIKEEGPAEDKQKYVEHLRKAMKQGTLDKELEMFILDECKIIMDNSTGDMFTVIMDAISSLKHIQTIQGRQQLVDLLSEQMQLSEYFTTDSQDDLARINHCLATAMQLCSKNVHASKFVNFVCDKVLSALSIKDDGLANEEVGLKIFMKLAELSCLCGNGEAVVGCLPQLFDCLKSYMPLPPAEEETKDVKLNFSHAECLLFTFHQICRHQPEFLTSEDNAEKLKDFRTRLSYMARGARVYVSELKKQLAGKTENQLKEDDYCQKQLIAHKTCNNVNTIIKDLFHNPPSYKTAVNLSWKKKAQSVNANAANKRLNENSSNFPPMKKKDDRAMYQAPSGKYSNNLQYNNNKRNYFNRRRSSGGKRY